MHDPRVFISYSSADGDMAERIAKKLSAAGLRVWLDKTSIPQGANWASEIERAVRESDVFVALLGSNFLSSDFGLYELGFAASEQRARGGTLLPVILPGADDAQIPAYLRRFQMIDARSSETDDLIARIVGRIADAGDTHAADANLSA